MPANETFTFLSNISKIISTTYKGDPNGLNAFITALELADSASGDNDKPHLIKFIKTKLEGRAPEAMPTEITSVQNIISALKSKIRPESSKVVLGRFLALRSKRNAMTKFQQQAEELADQLRRAYISEGMNQHLAEKTTIDKTVEMCRLSAKTNLVKSILASSDFKEPKEVVEKLIIESNVENNEAQVLYYRGNHQNQRMNGFNTFRGNGNYRGNYRGQNENNRNYNNRNRNTKQNFRGRGRRGYNNQYNNNNHGRYQNNRNQDGNNSRYVRVIEEENDQSPTTQRGQQNNTVSMTERRM
ncbi:putative uncharacterized protein DDB_G0284213 [Sitodiplosis mosellana]|uniref:putative uncharacterized protein DDB_G0284213 n=1 Tax=Sitodiplosis mosellana TaxID=263140 RepID=UPI002444315F|nr:putative uncharacterized protein DDB_G0284213 [Sitodiplosis mosellana]